MKGFIEKYTETSIKTGSIDSLIKALNDNLSEMNSNVVEDVDKEIAKMTINHTINQLENAKTLIDIAKKELLGRLDTIDIDTLIK